LTNLPAAAHNISKNYSALAAAGEARLLSGQMPTEAQLQAMNLSESEALGRLAVMAMEEEDQKRFHYTEILDSSTEIITDGSHFENGKLKPNVAYQTGEYNYLYQTNEDGLIVYAGTENLQVKRHTGRLRHNPFTFGKRAGDHAGHLIGDQFGGSPELDNLVSQAKQVNKSEYYKIEAQWARALKQNQKVSVDIKINYDPGSSRPTSFDVKYKINDEIYERSINNN